MVDNALFVDMTGAKESMRTLRMIANNLANANTTGFRADFQLMQSKPTNEGNGLQTRVHSLAEKTYSSFESGPIIQTGRDLDVAIEGDGFIAVQAKDGTESYTRAGNLEISSEGYLTTSNGELVLGHEGLINIPPAQQITIGEDGTITARLAGQAETDLTTLGRLKIVQASPQDILKGEDGLFRAYEESAGNIKLADNAKVRSGALEGSNVDPVRALTELIDMSRQFEMHTKLMKTIEDNTVKANQLLDTAR